MKNIVIMGAGELGKEIIWLIDDINRISPTWVIVGFLDDTKPEGSVYAGYPVLGAFSELEKLQAEYGFYALIALQNGIDKARIVKEHEGFSHWATIIHPTAVVATGSEVGEGSVIFPQVTVSVDSVIGRHCLLYIHAIICNDCILGDYVSVMSGVSLSEHVSIGKESYISAGCDVYPRITIGEGCQVAVGNTVEDDMADGERKTKKSKGLFFK